MRAPLIHARGQIRDFELIRPSGLHEATDALLGTKSEVRAMAGGIDLINALKCGERVAKVAYIGRLPELNFIRREGDFLEIGAAVTHRAIELSPVVAEALPDLPAIVADLGNVRIRSVGTIGGNLMCGHRYYDWLPILAALDAQLVFMVKTLRVFMAVHTTKTVPVAQMTSGDGRWQLPTGLLTTIRIPLNGRPALRFIRRLKPVLSMAICRRVADEANIRVAIGCMHLAPIAASLTATGDAVAAARRLAGDLPDADDDGYASGDYRRGLTGTLVARAIPELAALS